MRPFMKFDYLTVHEWMKIRGLGTPSYESLPPTGIIEDNVACGFLIKCDNKIGILDFFISNPSIPDETRNTVLDDIVYALMMTAKREGLKQVYCNSDVPRIQARALRHGFTKLGEFVSYSKELT